MFVIANRMLDANTPPNVSVHANGWDAFTQFAHCVHFGIPVRVGAQGLLDVCFLPAQCKIIYGLRKVLQRTKIVQRNDVAWEEYLHVGCK